MARSYTAGEGSRSSGGSFLYGKNARGDYDKFEIYNVRKDDLKVGSVFEVVSQKAEGGKFVDKTEWFVVKGKPTEHPRVISQEEGWENSGRLVLPVDVVDENGKKIRTDIVELDKNGKPMLDDRDRFFRIKK